MTSRDRLYVTGAIGFPWMAITAYLLWIWPLPRGISLWAELGPYLLSLAFGLPFAWRLSRGDGRGWIVPVFLVVCFVLLWIYALAVLCAVRNVCL